MKSYPTIDYWNKGIFGSHIFAFDKLDGSNIRAEWNRKHSKQGKADGFTKFGTRKQIIDERHGTFGEAVELFFETYAYELNKLFREDKELKPIRRFTVFFEFYSENSFAGWHDPKDKKEICLFDIDQFQKGFMKPKDFLKKVGHLKIPEVVYEGNYNQSLIENVRNNIYNLDEGVVVKGVRLTKRKQGENIWMTKIKTIEWLNKVKNTLGQAELLKEVNGDKTLIENL